MHLVHPLAPTLEKLPASHEMHIALPFVGAKVPGEHAEAIVEPVPHAWPTVQLEHCSALERFVALPYVPAKHASGADAPDGQYEPASQLKYADAAEEDW